MFELTDLRREIKSVNISNIIEKGLSRSVETWVMEKKVCCCFSIITTVTMDLGHLEKMSKFLIARVAEA